MIEPTNMVTFSWLGGWCLLGLHRMAFKADSLVPLALLGLFFFMGIPLVLDVVIGLPDYLNYPGFHAASRDPYTNFIYCLFMWITPPLIWFLGRKRNQVSRQSIPYAQDAENIIYVRRLRPLFLLMMISPLILLPFAPDPAQYFDLLPLNNLTATDSEKTFHAILTVFCTLSLQGVCGWLLSVRKMHLSTLIFVLPFTIIMPWFQFKRHAFAIVIVMLGYIAWRRGNLRGYRFLGAAVFCVVLVLTFSFYYLWEVRERGFGQVGVEELYEDFRIDFGRDNEIKLTIFAEVYPESLQILEGRGQALLYYASLPIPKDLWAQKPLKYPHYLTSAALGLPPDYLPYGLTTSILGQFIADFSWAGFFLGPIVISLLCRLTYRSQSSISETLGGMILLLLLVVHLSVVIPWMALWLITIIKPVHRKNLLFHRLRSKPSLATSKKTHDLGL